MIRREKNNGWILITQHDHAVLAGQIMAHWGNGDYAKPEPLGEVLLAAGEHDSGWREWDSQPKIDPKSGYPANFTEMNPLEQCEIWSRCYKSYSATHPYASGLIALHFAKFNQSNIRKYPDIGLLKSFQNDIVRFVAEKLDIAITNDSLEEIPAEVRTNLKLIQIGDIISLALCHGWRSVEITEVPFDYSGSETTLKLESQDGFNYQIAPYPFRDLSMKLSIKGKKVDTKIFSDDQELRDKFTNSDYVTLDFTIGKG